VGALFSAEDLEYEKMNFEEEVDLELCSLRVPFWNLYGNRFYSLKVSVTHATLGTVSDTIEVFTFEFVKDRTFRDLNINPDDVYVLEKTINNKI